jgi:NTP pyrophosphatase (non-canonical NTP hydrolase)
MIEKDMHNALREVGVERFMQEQAKADGKFRYSCSDPQMTDADRLAVLMEEVGEVATEVLGATDEQIKRNLTIVKQTRDDSRQQEAAIRKRMRSELAQVAAVAVAWMESIPVEGEEDDPLCYCGHRKSAHDFEGTCLVAMCNGEDCHGFSEVKHGIEME